MTELAFLQLSTNFLYFNKNGTRRPQHYTQGNVVGVL